MGKRKNDDEKMIVLREIVLQAFDSVYFGNKTDSSKKLPDDDDLLFEIINTIYLTGDANNYPIQNNLIKLLELVKNKSVNIEWEKGSEKFKDHTEFYQVRQSYISKRLNSLCEDGRIIELDNKVYIPYKLDKAREKIKKKIIEQVIFDKDIIFVLSGNREPIKTEKIEGEKNEKNKLYFATCSFLVDVRYNYISVAKDLFKQYIGPKNLYDILDFQEQLLVMIQGEQSEVIKLRQDFRNIVKETYELKNK